MNHYSYEVVWSAEDDCYIARVREFEGVMADGATPEEALAEVKVALAGVVDMYGREGWSLPEPQVLAVG